MTFYNTVKLKLTRAACFLNGLKNELSDEFVDEVTIENETCLKRKNQREI